MLAGLLVAYITSYVHISRTRWKEVQEYKFPGFLYVPLAWLSNDEDESWRKWHFGLMVFYAPINKIDSELFGGPSPVVCVLTGIGKKK